MVDQDSFSISVEELNELHTLRDMLRFGASSFNRHGLFYGHGTDNSWDEALALLLHSLCLDAECAGHAIDARLTKAEKSAIAELFCRRINERIPVPYLCGQAWFAGLRFRVDERVLIPRSPLGEAIENGFAPWLQTPPLTILDLCTGSGCIGIACAYAFPEAQVLLSDISGDALDVARQNVVEHSLDDRVETAMADLFEGIDRSFDLIVSNPPYVDAEEFAAMPAEFTHEPGLALSSGGDGLDFTRRLLREAADHLNPGGLLVVEVGASAEHLHAAFPEVPFAWLEFERGGDGVFALSREELLSYGSIFAA